MSRFLAETMPAVTVPPRLNGLPIATTQSPSRSLSESPNFTAVSVRGGLNFSTARSVFLSMPTISALILVPSFMMTLISSAAAMTWLLVTTMPAVSMMKPEPSELVLCGCRSPPLPPLRFLKKSSKNSSNGEPGGSCGTAPRLSPPPLASTVCEVEMLTTASITFSATSAIPSGPRACAGAAISVDAAPRQAAASSGRRRWLRAVVTAVILALLQRCRNVLPHCARTGPRRKQAAHNIEATIAHLIRQKADGKPSRSRRNRVSSDRPADDPDQDQAGDSRADSDRAQDVVRRRPRAFHRFAHPGRACREHQPFQHEQDSHTDEEVGERYGPHRIGTSPFVVCRRDF